MNKTFIRDDKIQSILPSFYSSLPNFSDFPFSLSINQLAKEKKLGRSYQFIVEKVKVKYNPHDEYIP